MAAQVRVLGEAYTPDDEEDSAVAQVTNVWVYQARYRVPLTSAIAGARRRLLLYACMGSGHCREPMFCPVTLAKEGHLG